MKIAILSMQRVVNFGSVLQAYSLREIVRELTGVQADFLDIDDASVLPSAKTIKETDDYAAPSACPGGIFQRGKRWIIARLSAYNKKKIRRFMDRELGLGGKNREEQYDHVIVGSDEVFNHAKGVVRLQLHGEVDRANHLFSYAASCGNASLEDVAAADLPRLKAAMAHFSAVSVRDAATEKYVSGIFGGEILRHMDPVLVGNLHLRTPKKVFLKKYLLVYAYGQRIRTAEEISAIRGFARAHGLKTVAIGGSQFWCDLYIPVSPMRALDYFRGADYVLTDTFHGAIFSILHHKKFAAILRKTNAGKLGSLLEELGLENRRLEDLSRIGEILTAEIDYAAVDAVLERERLRTRRYLKRQLMENDGVGLLKGSKDCSGCGACASACPVQAISMREAEYGCLYPAIDTDKCIRCGKCVRICEACKEQNRRRPIEAWAAVGCDEEMIRNSASGGAFASLAKSHLAAGGTAAGAVMDCNDGLRVFHLLSDSMEDLRRMQGSKYVRSDARRCYNDVLSALKEGRAVLFSGTPCQVAAIKALSGDPENLITMDLVCHGVPPLKMLADYAEILERRFGGRLSGLNFRDKSCGKHYCAGVSIRRGNKERKYCLSSNLLSFYKYFLTGAICRESCCFCPYASLQRVSDLTIGDYWGIEKQHAADFESGRMERRSDWSCVLVNTPKGQAFLHRHGAALKCFASEPEWIAEANRQLNEPGKKPANRYAVLRAFAGGGYAAVEAVFIKENGGWLRYHWRCIKNLRKTRRKTKVDNR